MRNLNEKERKALDAFTQGAADRGYLIAAGCAAMLKLVERGAPNGMPEEATRLLKFVYYSGAQHLFASIMGTLDDGEEITPADEQRMELIALELTEWAKTAGPIVGVRL